MELHLKPQADICQVSGHVFQAGDRVVSRLVRDPSGEFARWDVLAENENAAEPSGEVLCRWTRIYKPAPAEVDHERELKMTAETLFLELLEDPQAGDEADPNARLKQFLGLMLERKRVLKRRATARDQKSIRYEHMPSKRMVELATEEMTPAFFLEMHAKLGVLLGDGRESVQPEEAQPAQ